MGTAKDEIFYRIHHALRDRGPERQASYESIARAYIQTATASDSQRVDLFADRLHDYNAVVYRCPEAEVNQTIGRALGTRNKRRLLIPRAFPQHWLPQGVEFSRDNGLSYEEIDRSDGVVSGCALAIAITGTIVLRHSVDEGRRALTLIPDYHLCVVGEDQIVDTVPEGIRQISALGPAPITTIAGPSATADIEMTRVKGVHGPRTLDVVLYKS